MTYMRIHVVQFNHPLQASLCELRPDTSLDQAQRTQSPPEADFPGGRRRPGKTLSHFAAG